jgi:hypothetical protein
MEQLIKAKTRQFKMMLLWKTKIRMKKQQRKNIEVCLTRNHNTLMIILDLNMAMKTRMKIMVKKRMIK